MAPPWPPLPPWPPWPPPPPTPPPPPPPKVEAPKPDPKPEIKPELAELPVPKPEAKPEPKPEPPKPTPPQQVVRPPEPKPEPPKKKEAFDFNKLALLLDKKKPQPQSAETNPRSRSQIAPAASAAPGASSLSEQLTLSEKDAIRQQIQRCWNVPAGARDAQNLKVRVRIALNQDGSLRGQPELLDMARMSDSFYRAAAESAVRAVLRCSPLQDLPQKKYESWRDIELTFDPKEILGG